MLEKEAELRSSLERAWSTRALRIDKTFSEGLTGADVLLVDIQCDREDGTRFDGGAILKIQQATPELAAQEVQALRTACALPNRFSQTRIPRLVNWRFDGDKLYLLQEVAAQGIQFAKALNRAKADDRSRAVGQIAAELLSEWTLYARTGEQTTSISLRDLAVSFLGNHRLSAESRLAVWLTDRELPMSSPNFVFNRRLLPNPLNVLNGTVLFDSAIRPIYSIVHGDFHGNNILLERGLSDTSTHNAERDAPYYVIDVGSVDLQGLALYDLCYLEHAILRDYLSPRALVEALDIGLMVNGITSTLDIDGQSEHRSILLHSASIIQAVDRWTSERFPDRRAAIMQQFYVARVAAALNFANKRVTDAQRERSFLLAAVFCDKLIQFLELQYSEESVPWLARTVPNLDSTRLWHLMQGLDRNRAMFVHLTGPSWRTATDDVLDVLAAQPVSIYLEFDPQVGGALADRLKPRIQRLRPTADLLHTEADGSPDLPAGGTLVCFPRGRDVAGLNLKDASAVQWRRKLRPTFDALRKHITTHLGGRELIVLVSGFDTPDYWVREVWGDLAASVSEDRMNTIVVSPYAHSEVDFGLAFFGELANGVERIWHLSGTVEELSREFLELQGAPMRADPIEIPCRPMGPDGSRFVQLSDAQHALMAADFQIVDRFAAERMGSGVPTIDRAGADFFLGSEISWYELSVRLDVPRDIGPALTAEILGALRDGRSGNISLQHAPGAGGTTLGRRAAWDIRTEFPTIIVDRYSDTLENRVSDLYTTCNNLPLFIVMERSSISRTQREAAFRSWRARHVRFFLLEIERVSEPSTHYRLPRTMTPNEAKRFQDTYSAALTSQFGRATLGPDSALGGASSQFARMTDLGRRIRGRLDVLQQLTASKTYENYRSPFFYGFFAFETEFRRVTEFVEYCLRGLSAASRDGVLRAAIISRSVERFVPLYIMKTFFGLSPIDDASIAATISGDAIRLFVETEDGKNARIIHPLIAEAIIRQLAGAKNSSDPAYQEVAYRAAEGVIECISSSGLSDDAGSRDLVLDLFIRRDYWEDKAKRKNFSDLMNLLKSNAAKESLFDTLVEVFPSEAHFWHHLGRLRNLELNQSLARAAECFAKAIDLAPTDPYHSHGMGMVYRLEVGRLLEKMKVGLTSLADAITTIRPSFDEATRCFVEARSKDGDQKSEYPTVSHAQMIQDVLSKLFALSRMKDWTSFLASEDGSGVWIRESNDQAEQLMAELSTRYEARTPSKYFVDLQRRALEFLGKDGAALEMLRRASSNTKLDQFHFRRQTALYLVRMAGHRFWRMKERHVREIYESLEANFQSAPSRFEDFKLWLLAYRQLPEFDIARAERRVGAWIARQQSAEAYFYAYVVEYAKYDLDVTKDLFLVRTYMEECKARAPRLERRYSFEWLANEPSWFPMINHNEMGDWDEGENFFVSETTLLLKRHTGIVKRINGPERGTINLDDLDAFFVPGAKLGAAAREAEFVRGRDEGTIVTCHVGLSFDGLRAWNVRRYTGPRSGPS